MDRRQAVSAATEPIRDVVHEHPDQYGQLWIDQLHGGIVVVQIAPDGSQAPIKALMARKHIDSKFVRFERVKRSMAELRAMTDAFMHDAAPRLKARGIQVQSIGPDLPNAMRVGVVNLTQAQRRSLAKEFPDVRFETECVIKAV